MQEDLMTIEDVLEQAHKFGIESRGIKLIHRAYSLGIMDANTLRDKQDAVGTNRRVRTRKKG